MKEKTSKTLIGAFVLGALALVLIAVAIIGSGRLLSKQVNFVMFFDSSVRGLSPGSPVVFRGVPIGRVARITLSGDPHSMHFRIPVVIELDANRAQTMNSPEESLYDQPNFMKRLVDEGLRARLNTQSLLTGQLLIEFDFFDSDKTDSTSAYLSSFDGMLVIPTVPSQLETIWQRLAQLPIETISSDILGITQKINKILDSPGLTDIPRNVNTTLASAQRSFEHLHEAVNALTGLAGQLTTLTRTIDKETPETLEKARQLLAHYTQLAGHIEGVMENVRGLINPNSVLLIEFNRTVHEVGESAKAVRSLANTLERNPESLLMGKGADRR